MKPTNTGKSIALVALVVLALGGGLVYWQYSMHGDAEAHLNKIRSETPDEKKLQADLQTSQTELYAASSELKNLENGIPTLAYVPTLLKELEEEGNKHELHVTVFKQANPAGAAPTPTNASSGDAKSLKDKPYDEIEFDLSGRGSYTSVEDMLKGLQQFPKIISVQSITVTPKRDPNSASAATVETTIHMKAFIFKQAEETPKADLQANNAKGGGQ